MKRLGEPAYCEQCDRYHSFGMHVSRLPYNAAITKAVILRCMACPWTTPHIGVIITKLKYLCPKCGSETEIDGGEVDLKEKPL